MSHPSRSMLRATAAVGLMLLASPLASLHAQPAPTPAVKPVTAQTPPAIPAVASPETVEQRITGLHASLQITAGEEGDWTAVAAAMRANAGAMDKHFADRDAQDKKGMTAVDDLKMYQSFAQTHLDGLKQLTTAFETLYKSMPVTQQKNADMVFSQFGHHADGTHS